MFALRSHGAIVASLIFAVFLWGGNNTGVKFLVRTWPPVWVGSTRFLCAGLLMLILLRWTDWLGPSPPLSRSLRRQLWWRTALSLAVYIIAFNCALQFTAASHVALYLGAAPVWALLWEGRAHGGRAFWFKRSAAATLALLGVVALCYPALRVGNHRWPGELLGLAASVLWTHYGRQCRVLTSHLSGAAITAHTMWRAGLLLLPLALLETATRGLVWSWEATLVQFYCIIAGGVMAFALWNNALSRWKTSEVYLFNNLIPLSTMLWAHLCLGEVISSTFWLALALVISGVLIGQTNWQRLLGARWLPTE